MSDDDPDDDQEDLCPWCGHDPETTAALRERVATLEHLAIGAAVSTANLVTVASTAVKMLRTNTDLLRVFPAARAARLMTLEQIQDFRPLIRNLVTMRDTFRSIVDAIGAERLDRLAIDIDTPEDPRP